MQNEYDIKSIMEEIEQDLIVRMKRTLWSHREDEETKGFNWPQWQALKLKQIQEYKEANKQIFNEKTKPLNRYLYKHIKKQFKEGASKSYKEALDSKIIKKEDSQLGGSFFGLNHRKLDALIKSTKEDMQDVKYATLRMANDQYRQIIYKAQVYANTGAGTVKQAIDMATKDFLSRGFNCIEYKDGRRVNIADYCDMAIRTANKRANLMGEGEMRKKLGNPLVYISKHGGACDKRTPWEGRVYIDDVWSGGKIEDGKYPLLSTAIAGGLFHPRCQHGSSTYFEGINDEPEEVTQAQNNHDEEDKYTQYLQQRQKQYERLANGSLYSENIEKYQNKANELKKQIENGKIENNLKKINETTLEELREYGIESYNVTGIDAETANEVANRLTKYTKEYNTKLKKVGMTSALNGKILEGGHVEEYGANLKLVRGALKNQISTVDHEFFHTMAQYNIDKKVGVNTEFWKEIDSIKRKYIKELKNIDKKLLVEESISPEKANELKEKIFIAGKNTTLNNYTISNLDEFSAVSFEMIKTGQTTSKYAQEVVDIIDKYFKKEKSITIPTDIEDFYNYYRVNSKQVLTPQNLNKVLKYDDKPTIISKKEFDDLAKSNKYGVLERGFKTGRGTIQIDQIIDNYKNGEFYVGEGIYGSGTYTAYGKNAHKIALTYSADEQNLSSPKNIVQFLLKDDAKVIEYSELRKMRDMELEKLIKANGFKDYFDVIENGFNNIKTTEIAKYIMEIQDAGIYASIKGYDAIKVIQEDSIMGEGFNYIVILNRKKMIMYD